MSRKSKKPEKEPERQWTKDAMAKRLFPKQVIKAVKEQAKKKDSQSSKKV
jgi:hypothetical protein